jgi:hypothetical protein
MVGSFAAALDAQVAAIAAMNAVFACHYSHSPPDDEDPYPDLGARVILCILLQVMGVGCASASAVLLAVNLDTAFMIPVVYLQLLAGLVLTYHAAVFIGHGAFVKGLKTHSFYCTSLLISSAAFGFHASVPSPYSWFTFMAYLAALTHHILAASPLRRARKYDLARIAVLFIIAGAWASCAITTVATRSFEGHWAGSCKYVVLTSSAAEAGVLAAAGAWDIRATMEKIKEARNSSKGSKSA